jgi:thioesterase domain-containing protein
MCKWCASFFSSIRAIKIKFGFDQDQALQYALKMLKVKRDGKWALCQKWRMRISNLNSKLEACGVNTQRHAMIVEKERAQANYAREHKLWKRNCQRLTDVQVEIERRKGQKPKTRRHQRAS